MQRRDDQPTVFTDSAAAERAPSTKHETSAGTLPDGIARRTGVVFVHGIGTQAPRRPSSTGPVRSSSC